MARLAISLLGPFHATLGDQTASGFGGPAARALLAYLATEAREHTRRDLAGLLWPEQSEQVGLSNLRYALSDLRRVLKVASQEPPSYGLIVTRESIRLDNATGPWLDVHEFERLCGPPVGPEEDAAECARLDRAIGLYRGPFMEGFGLPGSTVFEDWLFWTRERLQRQMIGALRRLAVLHEAAGRYEIAESAARQQVQLEPLDESGHRQLMHVLAARGQRNAALAHYESCRRTLVQELGVEPMPETAALAQAIRSGALGPHACPPASTAETLPATPTRASQRPHNGAQAATTPRTPAFVAREQEMAQLERHLSLALEGQGRVVFVTGEAGSGKTVLMAEFVRQALALRADLVAAGGGCDAATGAGDPYLPFRQILQMLAGDIEARRAGGAISAELAGRLWSLLPTTVRALLDQGPNLIDTFVPVPELLLRVNGVLLGHKDGAVWRDRLAKTVEQRVNRPHGPAPARQGNASVSEQISRVLQEISRQRPLVLVLDDLQWVDTPSADLLFHLGRQLGGSRILILGAYRSPDIGLGRDGARHPLAGAINEFRREFGENQIDLTRAARREFLDAFLDAEPNHLDCSFRDLLYQHTGGHALFTVELLHALEARGSLSRDAEGYWTVGPGLKWEPMPARVEAVIAERIERLPQDAQALLTVASVEGEQFTAEVAAGVLSIDRMEVLGRLNGTLGRQHRLVRGESVVWLESGKTSVCRYRFEHVLFREYLYQQLDPVTRARLHQLVAEALEALYTKHTAQIALQLAHHFEQAGLAAQAIDYLLEAGSQAMRLAAFHEAAADYNRGLALLAHLPENAERAQREVDLRLGLAGVMAALHGWASPARAAVLAPAASLTQQANSREAVYVSFLQADHCRFRGLFVQAEELGRQMLAVAEANHDRQVAMLAHITLGITHAYKGEFVRARAALEEALRLYRHDEDCLASARLGIEAQALALTCLAPTLWALGYPEQATRRAQEAIAAAKAWDERLTVGSVLVVLGLIALATGHVQDPAEKIATLQRLVAGDGLPSFDSAADIAGGWLLALQGHIPDGVKQIRRGIVAWRARGMPTGTPGLLAILMQVCLRGELYDEGLQAADEAMSYLAAGIGGYFEAELYRLKGALTLAKAGDGSAVAAEACFLKAIDVARHGGARAWELRTTIDLARLWRQSGRGPEAHRWLAGIFGQFEEGFATPDLQAAAALLEELSTIPGSHRLACDDARNA
jgi:DNA-binding SARP family transcriptional activator